MPNKKLSFKKGLIVATLSAFTLLSSSCSNSASNTKKADSLDIVTANNIEKITIDAKSISELTAGLSKYKGSISKVLYDARFDISNTNVYNKYFAQPQLTSQKYEPIDTIAKHVNKQTIIYVLTKVTTADEGDTFAKAKVSTFVFENHILVGFDQL
jgi:hypothetical protein